jgi:hypothetical protein
LAPCAANQKGFMSSTIHGSSVHVVVLCFVLCTCHDFVFCAVYKALSMSKLCVMCFGTRHGPAWSDRESVDFFDFVFIRFFGHHENSCENHGAAPGHLFNRESMNFFDFVFQHHLGITKFIWKWWGSSWSSFQDPPPCVTHWPQKKTPKCPNICLTIFYYVRALDRCNQYTALWARSATGIEVCNRPAHCEGINGRQPHYLSTPILLAAPTRSAHGRAGATGSVRHKRVRCNSDK